MTAPLKDYYKILGVDKKADEDTIKKAFRKLARQYHPDANPNNPAAEARFKELSEAYEVVGDPDKRKQYDMLRANPFAGAAGGAGAYGGFGRQPGHGPSGAAGFGGLDDILQTIFRGAGAGPQSTQRPAAKGQNLEVEAEVTLEDVAKGTTITVTVTQADGSKKRLRVPIPVGVATGTKVRVAGEGEAGPGGGPRGDLFVKVTVRPHPRYTREGDDLTMELPVSVFDAVLGGEVTVPTLEGEVKLKIPAGTQGGKVFRLKQKGLPHLKGGERGALLVKIQLQIPDAVSEADRELWRQLAHKAPIRS